MRLMAQLAEVVMFGLGQEAAVIRSKSRKTAGHIAVIADQANEIPGLPMAKGVAASLAPDSDPSSLVDLLAR